MSTSKEKVMTQAKVKKNLTEFAAALSQLISISNRFAGRPIRADQLALVVHAHASVVNEFGRRTETLADVVVSSFGQPKKIEVSEAPRE